MRALRGKCDLLVVSIFINPIQFAANEDYENYPRTEKEDLRICADEGADIVFVPQAEDIYITGNQPLTRVDISSMTGLHCGVSRPPHFIGVLTIVSLLFNIVKPHLAAFGKKDFQQLRLVEIMVRELHIPVELVAVETGRTSNGLALSSRNRYLTVRERKIAPEFYATLCELRRRIEKGERDYRRMEMEGAHRLNDAGMRVDYVHICRCEDLLPAQGKEDARDENLVILGAVYLGEARLIDNVLLNS